MAITAANRLNSSTINASVITKKVERQKLLILTILKQKMLKGKPFSIFNTRSGIASKALLHNGNPTIHEDFKSIQCFLR